MLNIWASHRDLPQTKGLVMSKKNSRYEYTDFEFQLVDANGYEYEPFNPNSPETCGADYVVTISAMDFDYQNFTVHSAVRELTKLVKRHGNFAMGKDFFIKSCGVTVFDKSIMQHTDLPNEKVLELLDLINPKLLWVNNSK